MPLIPILASIGSFFVSLFLSIKGWFVSLIGVYLVGKIVQILIALGLGVATYEVGSYGLDSVFSYVVDNLNGLPVLAVGILHKMGVFEALSVMFGAMSARMTVAGLTSAGRIKK